MYLAYGWPQSIPLDWDDSDRVVFLRVLGRLLLAVCPASLHLWSATQHRVRLARFDRTPDSLAAHGHNAHAVWSPDAKTVAVLVSPPPLALWSAPARSLSAGSSSSPGLFARMLCADLVLLPPHIQGAIIGEAANHLWEAAPGALPRQYISNHRREGSSNQWHRYNVP
jgi:hypothetical protein